MVMPPGGDPVTQRSFAPSASASPLKYAAEFREGGSLKARPWGKLQGEKEKLLGSCLQGPQKEEDL